MKLLETLVAIASLVLAAVFGVSAAIGARQLISPSRNGVVMPGYHFFIGNVTLNDWVSVGVAGAAAISFAALAFYLLLSREKPHWRSGSDGCVR